jgi:hypothetical protein
MVVPFCTLMPHARSDLSPLESGGDDGARTRDLCRDRSAFDRNPLSPWALMANKSTLSPLKALQEIVRHPRQHPRRPLLFWPKPLLSSGRGRKSRPLPSTAEVWGSLTYAVVRQRSNGLNLPRQGDAILGEWQGQMAAQYGLAGAIDSQHFARLSEGQNPHSGEQLVRHRTWQEYTTADGTIVKPVEHRAGWDVTFSAPKSVSLTALAGGDDRVRAADREAVTIALAELERYT